MTKRLQAIVVAISTAALLVAIVALVVAVRADDRAESASRAPAGEGEMREIIDDDLRGIVDEGREVMHEQAARELSERTPVSVPTATVTVHDDGCGVIRSEFDVNPQGLGWSVRDQDGFEVLQRNAAGETRYRYFQGGRYTVVLVAWGGVSYVPISNEVTITC